jgi:hypothetical protein
VKPVAGRREPRDIWSDLQNGDTDLYPSDFAADIDGTFPRDLWLLHSGR